MTARQMINRLENLDVRSEVNASIEDTKNSIAELNTEQMYSGLLSTGERITPGYTRRTIQIKKKKGQPYDRVTLRDTGNFYEGYDVQIQGDQLIYNSPVEYEYGLTFKYGKYIWGLNPDNMHDYRFGVFFPVLKERVSSVTGMRFTQRIGS